MPTMISSSDRPSPSIDSLEKLTMKLIDLNRKQWAPVDAVRRARFRGMLKVYLQLTTAVGLLLYAAISLERGGVAVANLGPVLLGIRSLAANSFSPDFIEYFLSIVVLVGWIMGLISWFWIPAGSEMAYGSLLSKLFLSFCTILLLFGCAYMLFSDNSFGGLGDGRTSAMLRLGASSFLGAITVLNVLFGLAPMFLMIAVKSVFTADILPQVGAKN
jgi:hypothetical protein